MNRRWEEREASRTVKYLASLSVEILVTEVKKPATGGFGVRLEVHFGVNHVSLN